MPKNPFKTATRVESDSMGEMRVAVDKLWGAQTARSLINFPIGEQKMPKLLIHALGLQKQAAALANTQLGLLNKNLGTAIAEAAARVAAGELDDHFPLVVWQTGSGTQTNMNANEVIANLAAKKVGNVHPNDHCNLCQSSNDTFPTAMHIAAASLVRRRLNPSLDGLIKELLDKQRRFGKIVKMGRTHLQDAVPITLGQVFSGYVAQLSRARSRLKAAEKSLYLLAQGGTAVGTGMLAHPKFAAAFIKHLKELSGMPFKSAANKFAAIAAHDDLVAYSAELQTLAAALMKIANDIRFLASGPRGGLGELKLAANEPGSSIMPGKVNPTQAEALTQVCARVMGNHTAITVGGSLGHFELNVFKPLIIHSLLESIGLLADGMDSFALRLVRGIEVDEKKIAATLQNSLMLVTALSPHIGYDQAAKVAKTAYAQNLTLKQAAARLGLVSETDFDKLVRPSEMVKGSERK